MAAQILGLMSRRKSAARDQLPNSTPEGEKSAFIEGAHVSLLSPTH